MSTYITPIIGNSFIAQLIAGSAVAFIAAYIGSLMVVKRMALAGDALSHLALPGVALALALNLDMSIGALISLSFGALLLWKLERSTQLSFETLTAVIFASALAITLLVLPMEELEIALLGNLETISYSTALITVALSGILFFIVRTLFMNAILISFNRDLAYSLHVNLSRNDLIYILCVAMVVALGVKVVGSLLLAALVAIPAATSRNLTHSIFNYRLLSALFGCTSAIIGISVARTFSFSFGPIIILVSALFFALSLFFVEHR